jgi:hypothetical protein
LLPLPIENRVDGVGCLAVILFEQMRVDAQGYVRLGVPETLADGDDIHALVDELACVSMSQRMERRLRAIMFREIRRGLA